MNGRGAIGAVLTHKFVASLYSLDNSEWMRNGDYFPSRMEAQIDAVNVLMNWKFQANPENTVGILKMAKGYAFTSLPSSFVRSFEKPNPTTAREVLKCWSRLLPTWARSCPRSMR